MVRTKARFAVVEIGIVVAVVGRDGRLRLSKTQIGNRMAPYSKTIRTLLTAVLTVLIGVLVLQALAYGVSFAIAPAGGVNEFGYDKPAVVDDLTVALVGMIGVGMLGSAAFLTLAAILVWRANPAGAYVAMILGVVYILEGLCAFRAEWWWDARFFCVAGTTLVLLSAVVRWLHSQESDDGTG